MLFMAYFHLENMEKQLNEIAYVHNIKLQHIHQMLISARERILALHRMIIIEDPFEQDSDWMLFNHYGSVFSQHRKELMAMPLTPEEIKILLQQSKVTGPTVMIQRKVAEFALDGKQLIANKLLQSSSVPNQNKVFAELQKLYTLQIQMMEKVTEETKQTFHVAKQMTMIIGILAFVTSIVIAFFVIRRINCYQEKLFREKVLAEITLHSIADGVITTDKEGVIEYLNPMAGRMLELKESDYMFRPLSKVFMLCYETDKSVRLNLLEKTLNQRLITTSEGNAILLARSGEEYAIEYTVSPILDYNKELIGAIIVFHDMSELRLLSQQLGYQASHDTLTELINRRAFESELKQCVGKSKLNDSQHVLCFLDLDRFKVVNDTCGHAAGDGLLKRIASILRENTRSQDIISRHGGDEFALILYECSIQNGQEITEKIKEIIKQEHFVWDNKVFELGVSIGLVPITSRSINIDSLLSAADSACYRAKEMGRNRVCVYEQDNTLIKSSPGGVDLLPHYFQRPRNP
jgi:diguanylate cyclase (GGDEF)-like protein/PAS domain S-box-containing protein